MAPDGWFQDSYVERLMGLLHAFGVTHTCTAVACIVASVFLWLHVRRSKLPPGPFPLPFVGNIQPATVRPGLDLWYEELRAQYGDVFTVHSGMKPVVMVAGYDAIQELLIKNGDRCCIRDCHNTFSCLHNNQGLVWTAHNWLAQRKLTLRVWNKQDWRGLIGSETQKFVRWLTCYGNTSSGVAEMVQNMMARNLCSVLCKDVSEKASTISCQSASIETLQASDTANGAVQSKGFHHVVKLNERALGTLQQKILVPYLIPVLRRLPGDPFGWKRFQSAKRELWLEVRRHIEEHRSMHWEADDRGDFIDAWLTASASDPSLGLTEQAKRPSPLAEQVENNGTVENPFNDDDCVATLIQLVTAGADTLTSMIMWGLVHLIRSHECQAKLQHEIDSVIGADRSPAPEDRQSMPYTEAAITELLRISRGTFVSLPYLTLKPVTVRGHVIPQGTCVQAWLDSVHSDPKEFKDPEQFRPERYLNEHGRFIKPERYVPFSLGKRSCIGEAVVRTVAFLVFTTVFQKLNVSSGEAGKLPTADPAPGFLWAPQPFTIKAELRQRQAHSA